MTVLTRAFLDAMIIGHIAIGYWHYANMRVTDGIFFLVGSVAFVMVRMTILATIEARRTGK